MGFADSTPNLGSSPWGAAQAMRRGGIRDEEQIAERLLASGVDPREVSQITGLDLGLDDAEGMDPGIDTNAPDSFGGMPADDPEDTFGVMQDDEGDEPGPFDPSIFEEPDPVNPPMSVEQGIDQEIDPMGAQAQAIADAAVPSARPAVSVLEGGAGKALAEEIAKQKAAVPDAPPPEADPARIASLLTGGASGGEFDKASTENPDPGFLDTLKGAGGKLKSILSALAPSDAAAQALMATGFGMMGAQGTYGSTMGAIGQGGAAGMKTYQTAKRREDIAQAKADQLKSLEKRADATINMKRDELNAKKSTETSKAATAREKAAMARLEGYRRLASQGNNAEAKAGFAQDKELQEILHLSQIDFNRGPAWEKLAGGGAGGGDPKSMDGWRARIFGDMRAGRPVSEHDVQVFLQSADDNATREAFQAMIRLQETRDGQKLFRNMTTDQVIQWVNDKAEVFRAAETAGKRKAYGIAGDEKKFDVRGLRDGSAAPSGPPPVKKLLDNYKPGASGGS